MVGRTLDEIRERLEGYACDDGSYYLACARTGERPIPSGDRRFPDRGTATQAADLVDAYRAELRQYDPHLPHRDVIVRQLPREPTGDATVHTPTDRSEFCHEVAAAVFETLSGGGFRDAERAVMDAYLDAAETVDDPDDLCLLLLRSMGAVLDEMLSVHEQEVVLNRAAGRLDPVAEPTDALTDSLDSVAAAGLLDAYRVDGPAESPTVALDGYALGRGQRVLTLPLAVELLRRRPGADVRFEPTDDDEPGFRVTVVDRACHSPRGLLRVGTS
ncbi:DUF7551 domain-containing protein [Halarchaeum nitratireducens]|uniref:Uncharacterized protein n=1 Tax=Halarchaeum nitratireducens TaxID=489913 RepID=A0A830GAB9_9EURY|nr:MULTISPECIES: hypothetical protein [Halarchaeum]MBP2251596.1 hypothetical protein [Halarchaeum solikamskense]GGN13798.1 hypothetical protein GCM10009021_12420 [Halarchaeum nitratireducens]